MQRVIRVVVWAGVAAAIVGFVLPWAQLDLTEPEIARQLRQSAPGQELLGRLGKQLGRVTVEIHRGAETIAGPLPSLQDLPRHVSGIQIPAMVNQQQSQLALSVIELLLNTRYHAGPRSYAVYLVPGIALLCGLLITLAGRIRGVAFASAAVCAAIAAAGFWKLLTTNTRTLFIAITIGPGLWLSLWGYVATALGAAAAGVTGRAGGPAT